MSNKNKKNNFKLKLKEYLILLIIIISIYGIYLTSMLSYAKYNNSVAQLCGIETDGSVSGCSIVQNSDYATLFKVKNDDSGKISFQVPVAIAGLIYYILSLVFSIFIFLKLIKKQYISKNLKISLLSFSVIGVLSSVIFFLIQDLLINAFCRFCIYSEILTFLLFLFSIIFLIIHKNS